MLTQFSISVLNDWADREPDAAAGKRRPIALGRLAPTAAVWLSIIFALASMAGAVVFGWLALLVLLLGLAAGWAYDLALKASPFGFLAFAVGFPLLVLWTSLAAGWPLRMPLLLLLGGVPLAVAIHLADTIPDRMHDASAGLRTLPVLIGDPAAETLSGMLLLVGIGVTYFALWRLGRFNPGLLSLLLLAALYGVNVLNRSSRSPNMTRQLAKWTLIADAALTGLVLTLIVADG